MKSFRTLILAALILGLEASPVATGSARPWRQVKRQTSQLRDSYDFVIAGGGTTGLTIADRLTEAFPEKTVLVIEYGEIQPTPGTFDPPQTVWGGAVIGQAAYWTFNSLPNPDVKNKTGLVLAGKTVGGSSAVNGMFFDRPAQVDFDLWSNIGGAGLKSWDWDGLFPFFKKSVTFTEPTAEVVQKYGYTWDMSAYGGTTPIYSTFPPFLWADHPIMRNAWKELKVKVQKECAGGFKDGLCWIPISENPMTARRSHAGIGHYAAVNTSRSNYDLLVRHQVTKITYPNGLDTGPPVVQVKSLVTEKLFNVSAKAEVILSAGVFNTPSILLRSGIGPDNYLSTAGISLVHHLPGVGSNLQDHSGPGISWNYTLPFEASMWPLPSAMLDPDFVANATADFDKIPARGPYTLAQSNTALFLSLSKMASSTLARSISTKMRQIVSAKTSASYLPRESRAHPELVAGYDAQLLALAKFYENPLAPTLEVPWATGTAARLIFLHSLSRGTVRLNLSSPLDQPILDFRTASNPIDMLVHLAHVRFLRKIYQTPTMQRYGAVEVAPSEEIANDDAKLADYVKDTMTFSFMHPCCTAAMLPPKKGGVVGPDLKVHGLKGLRIADMSVLPVLPSSHLSALAYAVGEKAAHAIIEEWDGKAKGKGKGKR
ncbi:GMC oxidoreductase [Rhypophila decipiens]|uniref:GMC oxidoreductase n=1 Tax=Rhypophila decipiens TaxID=261697 RepID=A0AAN6XZ59_9PEZI|nr:GMC oxidoreductase [Rhypophila decipiens]